MIIIFCFNVDLIKNNFMVKYRLVVKSTSTFLYFNIEYKFQYLNFYNFSYKLSSLVRFVPMNVDDEESIQDLLLQIDNVIQYGEDADVKTHDFDQPEEEENENIDVFG